MGSLKVEIGQVVLKQRIWTLVVVLVCVCACVCVKYTKKLNILSKGTNSKNETYWLVSMATTPEMYLAGVCVFP